MEYISKQTSVYKCLQEGQRGMIVNPPHQFSGGYQIREAWWNCKQDDGYLWILFTLFTSSMNPEATVMGSFQANKQATWSIHNTRVQCSPTNVGLTQVGPNKLASSAVKSTMLSLHVLWIASSVKELSGTHISRALAGLMVRKHHGEPSMSLSLQIAMWQHLREKKKLQVTSLKWCDYVLPRKSTLLSLHSCS